MNWLVIVIPLLLLGIFFFLRKSAFIAPEDAVRQLAAGAKVIDVRSRAEFNRERVPGSINIPLAELSQAVTGKFPDKNQPLLVHCLSGGRSAIARQQLVRLGYLHVWNLGSLARTRNIMGRASQSENRT